MPLLKLKRPASVRLCEKMDALKIEIAEHAARVARLQVEFDEFERELEESALKRREMLETVAELTRKVEAALEK